MQFKEVAIEDLQFNPFTKIGKEWFLISSGNQNQLGTMTASWGSLGIMWGKNAVTTYIRPQRYTKEFIDHNDTFTISFFDESYRKTLALCGKISGRDHNKVAESGLTPMQVDDTISFEEANLILVCKKMYHAPIDPNQFDAPENETKWYPDKDHHMMYISEILKVLVKA